MSIENQESYSRPIASASEEQLLPLSDFDQSKYEPFLKGINVSEEQKGQFLILISNMMRSFVEMNIPAESWGRIIEVLQKPRRMNQPM